MLAEGLFRAASLGNVEICRLMVDQGAEVGEEAWDYCDSPLLAAVSGGHVEVVRYLIQAGVTDPRLKVHIQHQSSAQHPSAQHANHSLQLCNERNCAVL